MKKHFQATAAQQQEEIKALTATLKEQAKQIERVNALVPLTKPTNRLQARTVVFKLTGSMTAEPKPIHMASDAEPYRG